MIYKALMTDRTATQSTDAETLARKSVEDARAEADKLKDAAQAEARIIIENAYLIMSNAKNQAQKLIDDANEEAAGIRKHAAMILHETKADSVGINLHT